MSERITISGRSQSGKTCMLIRKCAEHGGYIVCRGHNDARLIVEQAYELGLSIPFPITFHEFVTHSFNTRGCSPLWVDDVGALLEYMTQASIGGFTVETGPRSIRLGEVGDEW